MLCDRLRSNGQMELQPSVPHRRLMHRLRLPHRLRLTHRHLQRQLLRALNGLLIRLGLL